MLSWSVLAFALSKPPSIPVCTASRPMFFNVHVPLENRAGGLQQSVDVRISSDEFACDAA